MKMAMQTPVHGTEAYDLSLFEERPARLKVVKPSKKVQKAQRRAVMCAFCRLFSV